MFATEKNGKPNTITIVPTMMVGRTTESSEKTERKLHFRQVSNVLIVI